MRILRVLCNKNILQNALSASVVWLVGFVEAFQLRDWTTPSVLLSDWLFPSPAAPAEPPSRACAHPKVVLTPRYVEEIILAEFQNKGTHGAVCETVLCFFSL